jgi:NAD(P)-dependent dehydrogenase (short-subunit alcohol dehydrogenase family)
MTGELASKVAVITGGSAGIGLGIAKRFVQEGARVFINGRRESELDKAVAAIGSDAQRFKVIFPTSPTSTASTPQLRPEPGISMCWR